MSRLIGHGVYEFTNKDEAIKACDKIRQRHRVHVAQFGLGGIYHVATEEYIRRWGLGTIIYSAKERG